MSKPTAPSIDELCKRPKGAFQDFIKQKENFLRSLESERKDRMRETRLFSIFEGRKA